MTALDKTSNQGLKINICIQLIFLPMNKCGENARILHESGADDSVYLSL